MGEGLGSLTAPFLPRGSLSSCLSLSFTRAGHAGCRRGGTPVPGNQGHPGKLAGWLPSNRYSFKRLVWRRLEAVEACSGSEVPPHAGPLQKQKGQKSTDNVVFRAAVSYVLQGKGKKTKKQQFPLAPGPRTSPFSLGFVVELSKPDGFWRGSLEDLFWFHFYLKFA